MDELSCNSWGNNAMFLADDGGQAKASTAIYWAARMIDEEWVQPGNVTHEIFVAEASETPAGGNSCEFLAWNADLGNGAFGPKGERASRPGAHRRRPP
jgi:hypothetical protein